MKKLCILSIIVLASVLPIFCLGLIVCWQAQSAPALPIVNDPHEVWALFTTTPDGLNRQTQAAINEAEAALQKIFSVPAHERTFENTCRAIDAVTYGSPLAVLQNVTRILLNTHPDDELRLAAQENRARIEAYLIDVWSNPQVYRALEEYVARHDVKLLTPQEKYYIEKTMLRLKKSGAHLPQTKRDHVHALLQEIEQLRALFLQNVTQDTRYFTATEQELAGTDLARFPLVEPDLYKITCSYPNYSHILSSCIVPETRKRMYELFNNRAYPENEFVLERIRDKQQQLAELLGYQSFAELDLDGQMANGVEEVQSFLDRMLMASQTKAIEDHRACMQYAPKELFDEAGKRNAWDGNFVTAPYIKEHYAFDQQEFSAYFSLDNTVQRMLSLYEDFFSLRMRIEENTGAWHEDVKLISVRDRESDILLGHIILDLLPREKKFGHFWTMPVVPALETAAGHTPAVAVVIGNFPAKGADKPPLLGLGGIGGIETLFHELGHAFHELLSATNLASQAGMNVPIDFIEMPSKMLEHLVWMPETLQKIGKHYLTGEPIPESLVSKAVSLKSCCMAWSMLWDVCVGQFALDLFGKPTGKSIAALYKEINDRMFTYIKDDEQLDRNFAAIGHLVDMYFAKYYSYAWSTVFAQDLFAKIQQDLLTDSTAWLRYRREVLAAGGSLNPGELVKRFLGREPSEQAFLNAMNAEGI